MAKQRYVNTHFWDDSYIVSRSPAEKLVFLYLLTNPLTNLVGIYEISIRRISFDTGLPEDEVVKILRRFELDGKIKYQNGWIAIKNFSFTKKGKGLIFIYFLLFYQKSIISFYKVTEGSDRNGGSK